MPKKIAKATPEQLFSEWWNKNAKKVARMTKLRDTYQISLLEPSVGKAYEVVLGRANNAFRAGHLGNIWKPSEQDRLNFNLDKIIEDAYLAGKESVS